jgi:hypothetical protein
MAATAEAMVPLTQHGFVVRDATPPGAVPRADDPASSGASGLSLGLLAGASADRAAFAAASASHAAAACGAGLPRAGDLCPAEFCHLTPGVKRVLRAVSRGLKAHQEPEAATEGLGGTYFFRSEDGARAAIMKPCDEEPLAPCNPKGFVGRRLGDPGLKPTVRVGEAAVREVAAYLLDHGGFARVPHTVMVRMAHPCFHRPAGAGGAGAPGDAGVTPAATLADGGGGSPGGAPSPLAPAAALPADGAADALTPEGSAAGALPLKLGSLQEFVPHAWDTSEVGASRFPVRDVHRIGALDLRLFNTDRHAGNILVRRARGGGAAGAPPLDAFPAAELHELIPIDHGFALPEGLEPPYFEWQHWPQAMLPFGAEELAYIAALDARADAALLRRELPSLREASLRVLEVGTTLLQRAAAAGLTLAEIGGVMARPLVGLDDEPSQLEEAVAAACAEAAGVAAGEDGDDDCNDGESGDEEESDVEDCRPPRALAAAARLGSLAESEEAAAPGTSAGGAPLLGAPPPVRASRLADDLALFSFDEDGARTPAGGGSPSADGAAAPAGRRAPAISPRGAAAGTPGGVVGVSFGSALASADSLPPSFDSRGAGGPDSRTSSLGLSGGPPPASASAAAPRASYVPCGGFASAAKAARSRSGAAGARKEGKARGGARRRRAAAYPPPVEPRACGAAAADFAALDADGWERFMAALKRRIDAALASGAWKQAVAGPAPPPMSCPSKF